MLQRKYNKVLGCASELSIDNAFYVRVFNKYEITEFFTFTEEEAIAIANYHDQRDFDVDIESLKTGQVIIYKK